LNFLDFWKEKHTIIFTAKSTSKRGNPPLPHLFCSVSHEDAPSNRCPYRCGFFTRPANVFKPVIILAL
jgi:hypothetical protein